MLETVTHLVLAITTSAIVAGVMMTLFGIHAVVWGTTSTTVRQRAVPAALLGRVTSVYMLGAIGGSALGVVIGGLIAQRFGITAPFWFAFFGSAILLALIWRMLAGDRARPDGGGCRMSATATLIQVCSPRCRLTGEPAGPCRYHRPGRASRFDPG